MSSASVFQNTSNVTIENCPVNWTQTPAPFLKRDVQVRSWIRAQRAWNNGLNNGTSSRAIVRRCRRVVLFRSREETVINKEKTKRVFRLGLKQPGEELWHDSCTSVRENVRSPVAVSPSDRVILSGGRNKIKRVFFGAKGGQ